jgi:hypothetical protein
MLALAAERARSAVRALAIAWDTNIAHLKRNVGGYLEEVRRLVEQFDALMKQADDDVWSVAAEAVVARTEEDSDLPF